MIRQISPWSLLLLFVLASAWGRQAEARLGDAEFDQLQAVVRKLMRREGEKDAKIEAVAAIASDDSARAVDLLIKWAVTSAAEQAESLEPAAQKSRAIYEEYRDKVLKKHKGSESDWSAGETRRLNKYRSEYAAAQDLVVTEINVQGAIGAGIRGIRNDMAIAELANSGVPTLLAANGALLVLEGSIDVLLDKPASLVGVPILNALARDLSPQLRIRALEWVTLEPMPDAALRVGPCLLARSVPVARAAVRTLKLLDDPRSVPSLVEGLGAASGLLADEIVEVLHHFTGHTLSGDAQAWERWWKAKGTAWLDAVTSERHAARTAAGDVSFYGIPTPSKRIVFVLDRSGSMNTPAITKNEGTNALEEKGTKLELAKKELRRAINQLGTDARFNVLFYNHLVRPWRPAPILVAASPEEKEAARNWFMQQKAVGSTALFAALHRALRYADQFEGGDGPYEPGADTIFLLSDGHPTNAMDKLMDADALEAAVENFLHENALVRCVVHTIGVGPEHNKELMKRLAAATGGTYVAVGMP